MNTQIKSLSLSPQLLRTAFLLIFCLFFGHSLLAQGNLVIHPKRIVFDGKKKIEKLVLSNTGKDSAVYNISFLEYKMTEQGALESIQVEEPGLRFASPYVRLYPRIVKLGPNESQILKVQLYNTDTISDGEYRSHLYFRAEQEKSALGSVNKARESLVSVKIEAVFGISIACLIRKGEDITALSISDISYSKSKDQENSLAFKLNRTGNMSAYGDFVITYITPNGKLYEVGTVKGIGLYLPGTTRNMSIKLNAPNNVNFVGGSFKVVFTENESKRILAEAGLNL